MQPPDKNVLGRCGQLHSAPADALRHAVASFGLRRVLWLLTAMCSGGVVDCSQPEIANPAYDYINMSSSHQGDAKGTAHSGGRGASAWGRGAAAAYAWQGGGTRAPWQGGGLERGWGHRVGAVGLRSRLCPSCCGRRC